MIDSIRSVAVVGAGYMGGGIAQSLARAGYPVVIADVSAEAAAAAGRRLVDEAERFEGTGEFEPGAAEAVRSHLSVAADIESAVAHADYIQEAVSEVLAVKHDVLGRISRAAKPDAIIGSNTSTLPVHELDVAVQGPERFLNVHWSNPAPFVPGVELIMGRHTDPRAVDVVKELLAAAGRSGARVGDVPGFVLNRLQYALLKEASAIVEEGVATVDDVDTIVRTTFGFRLAFFGPFAIADMAGLDVYADGFRTLQGAYGERMAPPQLILDAVSEGRFGVKSGSGLTGDIDAERVRELEAYRGKVYSALVRLRAEAGPSPIERRA
ncbi:3-hydroxyacyl-CoA dehydrogenase family protein [Microbacterium rhizomatis]|uniref:3-hydroxyacyl-CoA dehydrogenase family protein n=1 Tax=Microbacterium rhizomatis TaxID=1631477 RepID=A0A5J5IVY3_9MICO|nr:3-hydroxyacyl-CoA dehydrogenase family protein [Microbacterium rhizomatis]KAA9105090.1 3-hydroxyacyl-CoA dehydrogenase family protein [Microbacterium rhizomatis]